MTVWYQPSTRQHKKEQAMIIQDSKKQSIHVQHKVIIPQLSLDFDSNLAKALLVHRYTTHQSLQRPSSVVNSSLRRKLIEFLGPSGLEAYHGPSAVFEQSSVHAFCLIVHITNILGLINYQKHRDKQNMEPEGPEQLFDNQFNNEPESFNYSCTA